MKACQPCGLEWPVEAKFCGSCGSAIGAAAAASAPAQQLDARQVRESLASIPGITINQDLIEGFTGLSVILEKLQREPMNPHAHYRLAVSLDGVNKTRHLYRAVRFFIHPVGVLAGVALGSALKAADTEQRDPREASLLMAARLSAWSISSTGLDARMALLLGASALHLSQLHPARGWSAIATKAFTLAAKHADNAFVAADALLGLARLDLVAGKTETSAALKATALALGSKSSALGFPAGSTPSIWDIGRNPIPLQHRLTSAGAHTIRRQFERTASLVTKGAARLNQSSAIPTKS